VPDAALAIAVDEGLQPVLQHASDDYLPTAFMTAVYMRTPPKGHGASVFRSEQGRQLADRRSAHLLPPNSDVHTR
jgi:hypothetical protein